jgi:serine/threonine-protein kinase
MSIDLAWLAKAFPKLSGLVQLKSGGQKWVFRCQHPLHGTCALKLLRPGGEQYVARELEAVQRISSHNVPKIHETNTIDAPMGQLVWLLEQYVDGTVLADRLRQGPLDRDEIVQLARDLLAAAAEAEAATVVHRDIKPDNIILDRANKAWLLDFGIVRVLDLASITPTSALTGPHTPGYSAPEQFVYRKREIDGRSDLFAIGVVLYESATGANPFWSGARDRLEVLGRVERDPLPRLKLTWDVNGEFADLVATLTQKSPYQRPSSCKEALDWLEDILVDMGV